MDRWKKDGQEVHGATIYPLAVPGTTRTTRVSLRPMALVYAPPHWLQARKRRRVHGRILLIGSRYEFKGPRIPVVLISKETSQSTKRRTGPEIWKPEKRRSAEFLGD